MNIETFQPATKFEQHENENKGLNLLNVVDLNQTPADRHTAAKTNAESLPPLFLSNDLLAKQENATMEKTHKDSHGAVHNDYYMGSQKIFSDVKDEHSGIRTRTSFDMIGRAEGQRKDFADGSSLSQFKDDDDNVYRVNRNQSGIMVLKNEDGRWIPVKDNEECSKALNEERSIFVPPHVVMHS